MSGNEPKKEPKKEPRFGRPWLIGEEETARDALFNFLRSDAQGALEVASDSADIALDNLCKLIALLHEKGIITDEELLKNFLVTWEKRT